MNRVRLFCSLVTAVLFSLILGMTATAYGQGEYYNFDTQAQEVLFNKLTKELRCPKCQNQSIADSDAPLAEDMRIRVHEMVLAGASYDDVVGFMKVRYGDFVHYRPPVNATTLVLWVGPLVVFVLGVVFIVLLVRSQKKGEVELSAAEEAQLTAVLTSRAEHESSQSSKSPEA